MGGGFLGVAYVTVDEYKILGLPAEALEEVLDSEIQAHIDVAAGVIDSHLSRYDLPLVAPFPEALKRVNTCLATWYILLWRGYNPETFDQGYRQAFEDCMAYLGKIASGELTLPGVEDQTPGVNEGAPRVTSQPLRGW